MSTTRLYCRFCAEEKPYSEITHDNRKSVIEKLSFFDNIFVDFSIKMLPETLCISCYQLLVLSHEFFLKVKKAQVVLTELFGVKVEGSIVQHESRAEVDFSNFYGPTSHPNPHVQQDSSIEYEEKETKEEFQYCGKYLQGESGPSYNTKFRLPDEPGSCGTRVDVSLNQDTQYDDSPYSETIPNPTNQLTWTSYPWSCSICGQLVDSITRLREHCKAEHERCAAYQCADCPEQFQEFLEFVVHVRTHRKVLRHYCEHCNVVMDGNHKETHLVDHTCTRCGDTFQTPTFLNAHLKLYAAKPTGLLAFDLEIFDLDDSVISTWADYPSWCQFCNLKVGDKDILSYHCIEVHKKCFGRQCIDCDEKVDSFKEFLTHVMMHRPSLRTICPYCNIDMGSDPDHVNTHINKKHSCVVCGEIFGTKQTLRAHQSPVESPLITPPKKRRRHPLSIADLTCEVCGTLMKTVASLKKHIETHADRKRNYTCERCGKTYYSKGSLDVHKVIHENIVKEFCKICNKAFLTMPRLKKHIKTHNLAMPYQCNDCKRCFSSKDRIREHVKVHMDNLPFKCQYCSKKFRHKSIVKTHENQHTGAKPYSCDICCMDFANWSNCNKHMKRKHGTTIAKNVMTPYGKLALNPKTGKPDQLFIDNKVKEWSEKMLMREKGKNVRRQQKVPGGGKCKET